MFSRHCHVDSLTVPSASRDKGKPYKDKVSGRLERNSWATWLRVAFPITTQGKPVPFVRRREAGCKIRRSVSPSSLPTPPCLNLRGLGHLPETQVFICPHFPDFCFYAQRSLVLQSHWKQAPPQNMFPAIQTYMFFFLISLGQFMPSQVASGSLQEPSPVVVSKIFSSSFAKLKVSYKVVVVS